MKAKLTFDKLEIAAMIEANVTQTWPCIPGHKWDAQWKSYDEEIVVSAVKIEAEQAEVQHADQA